MGDDFQPGPGVKCSWKGPNFIIFTTITKKTLFSCNPNMESLMCNNDTIFRYRGLKKIEQVHTTTVFEFSKKKHIKINKFDIF